MLPSKLNPKKWMIVCIAILLVFALSGCGKKDKNIVATYENGQVSQVDFNKFLSLNTFFNPYYDMFKDDPTFQEHMLKQLIAFRLLSAGADDAAKADADAKTKQQMDEIAKYFETETGGKDGFETKLKEANPDLTVDDVKNFMHESIIVGSQMENRVTDQSVKDEYDKKLKENPHEYDIATVNHILIGLENPETKAALRTKEEALQRAKEVREKLVNGADFAALAKEYSDDPGSKDNGGKYENEPVVKWAAEFEKAVIDLPVNQISEPVETTYGYHIIRVDSKSSRGFDEVKPGIRSELAQNEMQKYMTDELPGKIKEINLPKPEAPAPAPADGQQAPAEGQPSSDTTTQQK